MTKVGIEVRRALAREVLHSELVYVLDKGHVFLNMPYKGVKATHRTYVVCIQNLVQPHQEVS